MKNIKNDEPYMTAVPIEELYKSLSSHLHKEIYAQLNDNEKNNDDENNERLYPGNTSQNTTIS